jgi:proteic killer suppression protein
MIKSYRGKYAEVIHTQRKVPKGFPADIANIARRKLVMLNGAQKLEDLKSLPGNRLEELKGDLKGKHSIRINDKWRILFKWTEQGPEEVDIVDYHD